MRLNYKIQRHKPLASSTKPCYHLKTKMTEQVIEAESLWKSALGQIQLSVNKNSFETWFKNTKAVALNDDCLSISTDNSFIQENLRRNQTTLCENVLSSLRGRPTQVKFVLPTESVVPTPPNKHSQKNPEFTFASLVVGEHNRLAVSTALSVARHPGQGYNPLVIYGKVGLGKTHLLKAIGNLAEEGKHKAIFISSEQFTNEFVAALKDRKTDAFHQKYRSTDLLLIDDIQFISGKTQTEECFFHTFNELRNGGKQLVISSNCHPRDIPEVDARLRSRFEWGISVEISLPNQKNRQDIVHSLLLDRQTKAEESFVEFLASLEVDSVRELIGNYNKAIAFCRLKRIPLSAESAREALNLKSKPLPISLDTQRILAAVCSAFAVSIEEIKSGSHQKNITMARRVAVYLLKQLLNMSLSDISVALDGKSVSALSQNYNRVRQDLENDLFTKRKISEIKQSLS